MLPLAVGSQGTPGEFCNAVPAGHSAASIQSRTASRPAGIMSTQSSVCSHDTGSNRARALFLPGGPLMCPDSAGWPDRRWALSGVSQQDVEWGDASWPSRHHPRVLTFPCGFLMQSGTSHWTNLDRAQVSPAYGGFPREGPHQCSPLQSVPGSEKLGYHSQCPAYPCPSVLPVTCHGLMPPGGHQTQDQTWQSWELCVL